MSIVDAELMGGPMDGSRHRLACPPEEAGGDGGPLLLLSFYARRKDVALPTDEDSILDVIEVRYARQMLPPSDGTWRYRYIPPPPEEDS